MSNPKYFIMETVPYFPQKVFDTLIDIENIQIVLNGSTFTLRRDLLNDFKGDDTLYNEKTSKAISATYESLYHDSSLFEYHTNIDYPESRVEEYLNSKFIFILEDPVFNYFYLTCYISEYDISDIIIDYTDILTKSAFNDSIVLNSNYEIIRNDAKLDIVFEKDKSTHTIKDYNKFLDFIYDEENKNDITREINEIVDGIGKSVLEKFKFTIFSLDDLKKYAQRYK